MMKQVETRLEYSEKHDCYFAKNQYEVVRAIRATQEDYANYLCENYGKIFPEYDKDKHRIDTSSTRSSSYIVLKQPKRTESISTKRLPAGLYRLKYIGHEPAIKSLDFPETDNFIPINNQGQDLVEELVGFFQSRELYEQLGSRFKRGTLVYGPPGNGKTLNLMRGVKKCINKFDCAAFLISKDSISLLSEFRTFLESQSTICIFEELTEMAERNTNKILSLLDGELSWQNNYNVATTNYPGKLPSNLVDRPGRFDRIIKVPNPGKEARRQYLQHFLENSEVTTEIIHKTRGFSVAYLKELVLSSRLYHQPIANVLSQFQRHKERIKEAFKDPEDKIGFMKHAEDSPAFVNNGNGDHAP